MVEDLIKSLLNKHKNNFALVYAEISKKLFQIEKKGISRPEDEGAMILYRTAKQMIKDMIVIDYMQKNGFVSENLEEWIQ